jgi:UDP-N-acetylmuramyl pentapeptide phosphotransferase/UDP-N-acetylglucosamine-1-phosphate transferase
MLLLPAAILAAFLVALGLTGWLVGALRRGGVVDEPNARSSHTRPTPRGGGWAVLAGALPAWAVLTVANGSERWSLLALAAGLAVLVPVCWRDDRVGVPWRVRLGAQGLAVALALLLFVDFQAFAPGRAGALLGALAVLAVMGALWLAFLNAFNFMDGIDGIAATQAIAIALGVALVAWRLELTPPVAGLALTLAAATAGFLVWNRPPARIFLGEVGSVPLAFLLGFLLVLIALDGAWGAALALPSYFGADALLTLLRRWRRGARLTEAHREHAYQRAAGREPAGHAAVLWRVAAANAAILAAVAVGLWIRGPAGQLATLALAALVVLALLAELERLARARGS